MRGPHQLETFMQFPGWADNRMKTTIDIRKAIDRLDRFQQLYHANKTWLQFCSFLASEQKQSKKAWRIPSYRN